MGRSVAGATLAIFLANLQSPGQPIARPPEFEVASVKPSQADVFDVNTRLPSLDIVPGRTLTFANITLHSIVMLAYGVGAAQISGPDVLANRFDIVAKVPGDAAKEDIPAMLQTLLARRFGLLLHRDKRTIPIYALEVNKGGTKLRESPAAGSREPGCTRSYSPSPGASFVATCSQVSSASLAQALQTMAPNYFDRPVVDMTGLKGDYDLTLEWISFAEAMNGDAGPTIFAAVQRLGLKLTAGKQRMDILVIDRCEKEATAN